MSTAAPVRILLAPRTLAGLLLAAVLAGACLPAPAPAGLPGGLPALIPDDYQPTPFPTRPNYAPGEKVEYTAQSGDTLPALAARFNTSVDEILEANSIIPTDATTLPPGLPMEIPIYYLPLWGSPFEILPDHAFVNGPTLQGFDTSTFVRGQPGWLKDYVEYAGGATRSGAQIVELVAANFSISPRLLLALLEYQAGALSNPDSPSSAYPLGHVSLLHQGLYLQLVWAANTLNNGYYGWRTGRLTSFDLPDRRLTRPDPWLNAASVGLQYYFSRKLVSPAYDAAIGAEGLVRTYTDLFGDPWEDPSVLISGSLRQPYLRLPFPAGRIWTYTGGPHSGWGDGEPLAAIDFAPPAAIGGCVIASEQATAVADGLVVRSESGILVLDLDGDGDERTGWTIFYLHIASEGRVPVGTRLKAGDPVGFPSCEGGRSTGTHIHIARKYNGEWIPADGPLAFTLEGWVARNGPRPYLGTLVRENRVITACECSDAASQVRAGE
jgi:LasA protease